jgi:hypothetical protein
VKSPAAQRHTQVYAPEQAEEQLRLHSATYAILRIAAHGFLDARNSSRTLTYRSPKGGKQKPCIGNPSAAGRAECEEKSNLRHSFHWLGFVRMGSA